MKEKNVQVTLFLPESLYQKVIKSADENSRSISGEVRHIVSQAIKKKK